MDAPKRYSGVAIALHWIVALLLLSQIALGWWMIDLPKSPPGLRAGWFNVHKSIGLTVGLLALLRLAWRWGHRAPPFPASLPIWQARAARVNHFLLYACLIVQPIIGYLGSSFSPYPIKYFGVTLPHWGWNSPRLKEVFSMIHWGTAIVFTTIVTLHILAAFKHLLVDRDGVFGRMWPRHKLSSTLVLCAFVMVSASAIAAPTAFVANEIAGTISMIDTGRDEVFGEIRAGSRPRGMAVSLDGKWLYVSEQPNLLFILDVEKRAVHAKIELGESPEGVSLSPDGKWVVAAVEVSNWVAFVDTQSGKLVFTVKTLGKNPEHAAFSPDGRWVYASAEDADSVDVIDVAARRQVATIQVARRPRGIAFTPDGRRAYVACELDSTVFAIDVAARTVLARIPAGDFSNGVAMRPDGARVFVSNGRAGTVSVIDTASNKIVATVAAGKRPWNMDMTPDGKKLYVANGRSNSVSVIDTETYVKLRDIPVGERPWGVVVR
ncbi:MAG: cytochrome b/b6 domain-containing protein [Burkholderiales bacterium]